jgi:hypothetical protein
MNSRIIFPIAIFTEHLFWGRRKGFRFLDAAPESQGHVWSRYPIPACGSGGDGRTYIGPTEPASAAEDQRVS